MFALYMNDVEVSIPGGVQKKIKWGGATVRCEPGPSDLQLSTIPVCEYCCQEWKGPTI